MNKLVQFAAQSRALRNVGLAFLVAAALAGSRLQAGTVVVNFDDLVGEAIPVADGYGGITWGGEWAHYGSSQFPYTAASPEQRIYNLAQANNTPFLFSTPVVFNGADFSGYDFSHPVFNMYLAGNLVATSGTLVLSDTPQFLASGYAGLVDRVEVSADLNFGIYNHYVMDNVTYTTTTAAVPEPTSIAIMGLGLAGVGLFASRRRKQIAG